MSNNVIPFKEKLKIAFYGGFFMWVVSPIALFLMLFDRTGARGLLGNTTNNNTTVTNSFNRYGDLDGMRDLASQAAEDNDLNESMFFALIKQESRWDPNATSSKGARGLGQIMPATAKAECGITEPDSLYDPAVNLNCSAKILRGLMDKVATKLNGEGDVEEVLELALAAYNSGLRATFDHDSLHTFPETRNYVARIMKEVEL